MIVGTRLVRLLYHPSATPRRTARNLSGLIRSYVKRLGLCCEECMGLFEIRLNGALNRGFVNVSVVVAEAASPRFRYPVGASTPISKACNRRPVVIHAMILVSCVRDDQNSVSCDSLCHPRDRLQSRHTKSEYKCHTVTRGLRSQDLGQKARTTSCINRALCRLRL